VIGDEADLAWTLALAVKPQLSAGEHNFIFVTIGAGDMFGAIRTLIKWVVIKRIPMTPDLARRCASWLDAYVGHNDERYLRRLVDDFLFPSTIQASVTLMINRLPAASQRSQPAASGTESGERAHLVHHIQRSDLVRLRERRVVEHRIH
jgi:hypothetical protein